MALGGGGRDPLHLDPLLQQHLQHTENPQRDLRWAWRMYSHKTKFKIGKEAKESSKAFLSHSNIFGFEIFSRSLIQYFLIEIIHHTPFFPTFDP